MRVGIEVGGTFTDLVAIEDGRVTVAKVPSTREPEVGAFNALEAAGLAADGIADFAHGTTVATNAILERKGAKVAFVTTRGFRDLLHLQRHDRSNIYDLQYRKPVSLVGREACHEVDERVLADGSVLTPLDVPAAADRLSAELASGGIEAVAICLLNAYANPAHEQDLAQALRARSPNLSITCSSDVVREFREYERASTTALSAYVQPVIGGYLARFRERLREQSFAGRFTVMQSNGGLLPAEAMERNAITALFSGPAAGVVGAARQVGRSGFRDLITFDMGGTSTDVSLVAGSDPGLTNETQIDGLPLRTPILDIVTVGAGGGSIVWLDDGGMLQVGPRSAGAVPGPACYGKGGTEPTITDAHVVCGTIHADTRLAGRVKVDLAAARKAFEPLAQALGLSVEEAAESAVRLANANIVRAIQLISTERGRDPRDYVIVPFGGAGALHATAVAADLGVERVVIPPNPGVMSAFGLLASDYVKHGSLTRRLRVDAGAADCVREDFAALRADLEGQMREMGVEGPYEWTYGVDMRFVGQAFEVTVYFDGEAIESLDAQGLEQRFVEEHQRAFFHGEGSHRPVEMICMRLECRKKLAELPLLARDTGHREAFQPAPLYTGWRWEDCLRVPDGTLEQGQALSGPAIVHGRMATIAIGTGWRGHIDSNDNLILEKE
ncbi:hydantoinase/oxoprolinase family protein [Castellaniella sp. GW247-6E4]|uniref:hydantoinase/oxoprolinase family protein n=1 Tax=Castellaniella sp. GW247-6E4 TaxID=3140380 RepID=UPI00331500DA